MTIATHMLERVDIVDIRELGVSSIEVRPIWKGVDRECSSGWGFRPEQRPIAERLRKAILADAFFTDAQVLTDVNGRTYVGASHGAMGRTMERDLERIGY